ncbi:MAG: two-component system sensor histidine kinase LytS, partial [bacterium]
SSRNYILLEDEVGFLKNYLKIEQLRFPDRFKFKVKIILNDETGEVMIPPLIVQPIIENCVKHAFQSMESGGEIIVQFSIQNKTITCLVIDNGIGINSARKHTKTSHNSIGVNVVKNRLALIPGISKDPIIFIDLSEEDETKHGTKVVIKIPLL